MITTGGALGEVAARSSCRCSIPGRAPPRAALGYTMMLLAGLLERAGMLDLGDARDRGAVAAAARWSPQLRGRTCRPQRTSAKQLAWSLLDRLPVIEAAGFLAPVARAGRRSSTRTASPAAAARSCPRRPTTRSSATDSPDVMRDHLYVVFLASSADHPRNRLRARCRPSC